MATVIERLSKNSKVDHAYRDNDGYWVEYKCGWKSGSDPLGAVHGDREDTARDIVRAVSNAIRCSCVDCCDTCP
jgi:hypothetical protein